jgi:NAD(P)-dependent dehydrogenase (short-subunit alcohol dehydrogenase family)
MNIHSMESQRMSTTAKTVLITGATAGIGRTTALHLAASGYHVIATGRRQGELDKLRADVPAGSRLDLALLDVTSPASIAHAVEEVDRLTGGHGVDELVNNAGYGLVGPLTEISDGDLRKQYDTNVFGLMAVTRAFVPRMRERGQGRVINVSSMGGKMTFPFMGAYNSTKYAIESLSDALRYELSPFGIDVVLIEPGAIHTNFAETSMGPVQQYEHTAYGAAIAQADTLQKRMMSTAVGPMVVARAIHKAIRRRRPAARYVAPWYGRFVIGLLAVMPTRVTDAAMRRITYLTPSRLKKPEQLDGATARAS